MVERRRPMVDKPRRASAGEGGRTAPAGLLVRRDTEDDPERVPPEPDQHEDGGVQSIPDRVSSRRCASPADGSATLPARCRTAYWSRPARALYTGGRWGDYFGHGRGGADAAVLALLGVRRRRDTWGTWGTTARF
jgi:hypothetical protein